MFVQPGAGLLRNMVEEIGVFQICVAEVWRQHGITSIENVLQGCRDPSVPCFVRIAGRRQKNKKSEGILSQDSLALLGGMVSSGRGLCQGGKPLVAVLHSIKTAMADLMVKGLKHGFRSADDDAAQVLERVLHSV